jgi:hypothetical protein
MEALRVGTRVAILWDVTKGRRKTSVWWSATITRIAVRAARGRSATVQYDAQHGYKTTVSKVCFRTGREFVNIESGGKMLRHLWRCVGTASSQVGGASSISTPPFTARQLIASKTTDLGPSMNWVSQDPTEVTHFAWESSSGFCRSGFPSALDLLFLAKWSPDAHWPS